MVRVAIKSRDVLKKLHPIKHRLVPDLLEKVIKRGYNKMANRAYIFLANIFERVQNDSLLKVLFV